ncbi:type II toxin-antitoxin system RelE/ParE family toxin [Clostridium sp. JN-1]|mgnify:CR=1 FL=1|jgi:phage-related protein|uniref:type II toxin-antitoxin system RelE/ParE family toxin n=1 Tax=Clostridium sp. JN-1 TaxID=2483110 RepID=UPI000F0B5ACC|nr:type II toxin-antitoxin system RelE/ParE family toxin [Clostridium sp. JN-1]
MWDVDFYRTKDDIVPVEEFLNSLNIKMRAKALHELNILQQFGISLREPYSKSIKDGIFELRIKLGSDISRIFYFFRIGNKIILTNGFIKKAQNTPKSEINKALRYKADYEGRYGK